MSMNHGGTRVRRSVAMLCAVLWALATMWMAGGVAHADGTSTNDSRQSSASEGGASTSEPATHDKPTADSPAAGEGAATGESNTQKADTQKSDTEKSTATDPPRTRGTHKHGTSRPAAKPKTASPAATDTTSSSKSDTKADAKPAATTPADADAAPRTTTAKTVTVSAAAATLAAAPTAAKVATAAVTPSATASVPNPIKQITQFARQMTGLANDLALIAVSLVNNLAAAAATTIGPKPFFGLPYNIAKTVAGTTAIAAKLLDGTPLDAVSEGPYTVDYGVPDLLSWLNPVKSPAGANLPFTGMSADHPLPIILLNGTSATQGVNWSVGAPVLANAGYTVYTFNYGNTTTNPYFPVQATADIRKSAQELSDEVDRVLDETGADKVILIGHSQGGGIMPSYYINNLHGDEKVSQFIGIAPSNHGTNVDGLVDLKNIPILGPALAPLIYRIVDLFGAAWTQQAVGSPLQQETYGAGDTRPGVLYTTIASKFDWVVTPYTQQALAAGPNVTNIVLQDLYPNYNAGHLGIVFSAPTWTAVLGALAANPAANVAPTTALAA
ncbi:alpha/beta fold hydrolase [Mycolicibacterium fluoranthenivorans]|nr:alpha/beta fold hydrolase [Mycolicibacterium fluoranthenivorans]